MFTQPPATGGRSYSVLPPSGPETDRRFASIGRRPVVVVVWGVRSDHRQVVVSNGSYEEMRAEALAAARAAGAGQRGRCFGRGPAARRGPCPPSIGHHAGRRTPGTGAITTGVCGPRRD